MKVLSFVLFLGAITYNPISSKLGGASGALELSSGHISRESSTNRSKIDDNSSGGLKIMRQRIGHFKGYVLTRWRSCLSLIFLATSHSSAGSSAGFETGESVVSHVAPQGSPSAEAIESVGREVDQDSSPDSGAASKVPNASGLSGAGEIDLGVKGCDVGVGDLV